MESDKTQVKTETNDKKSNSIYQIKQFKLTKLMTNLIKYSKYLRNAELQSRS